MTSGEPLCYVRAVRSSIVPFLLIAAFGCAGSASNESSILRGVECVREYETIPPEVWESEIAEYEAADVATRPDPGSIVFVGSSSIRFWETLAEGMAPMPVLNRGFGGSLIAHSTHFADRIIVPYQPTAIVLYAGDNDIAFGSVSPECALRDYEAFVAKIHATLPTVPIYFISIKPSIARWTLWDEMEWANRLIEARTTSDSTLQFIDVSKAMLSDQGEPIAQLFVEDGIHLSAAGYSLWTAIVKPRLFADLGF